jgi:hypothetical protein
MFTKEMTNINFEYYEDIPVEVTGLDIPAAINTVCIFIKINRVDSLVV